jgi:hypothetical protein
MSIIIRADDDTPGRKGVKMLGKTVMHFMQTNKKSGDHIEVTERIEPGTYKFTTSEDKGHISIDLTPGKE